MAFPQRNVRKEENIAPQLGISLARSFSTPVSSMNETKKYFSPNCKELFPHS